MELRRDRADLGALRCRRPRGGELEDRELEHATGFEELADVVLAGVRSSVRPGHRHERQSLDDVDTIALALHEAE